MTANELSLIIKNEKSMESKMESGENGACTCRIVNILDNDFDTLDYMG